MEAGEKIEAGLLDGDVVIPTEAQANPAPELTLSDIPEPQTTVELAGEEYLSSPEESIDELELDDPEILDHPEEPCTDDELSVESAEDHGETEEDEPIDDLLYAEGESDDEITEHEHLELSEPVEPPTEHPESGTAAGTDYVSGRNFTDFALGSELLRAIAERGYTAATQVQAATIEPGLAGLDLIVRAKTGTGKTAAFAVPIIEKILGGERVPKALVLTPTRELALQVAEECAALARYKDIRVCVLYGGVPIGPQTQALKDGVELVVGTPGRILDHLRRGNLDLSQVTMACLDEADEMLSMGFLEEVTHILDRIPPKPQVLLFSATVGEKVAAIVRRYLKDPERVYLSSDTDRVEGIRHVLYETSPEVHKARALIAILAQEEPLRALVFCNTREDASTVATFLDRQGLDAQLISGELPQKKRESVMEAMKAGQIQFLVCTDVAARGIDISDLTHVVNYSLPEDPAVYLHRTGRTGRIGKAGTAISLAGGTDLNTRKALERDFAIEFEVRPLPSPDEAVRLRMERQATSLKNASNVLAFESYLGMVKALQQRPDGDVLLAVALRAFFLWDRERVAASQAEPVAEPQEQRAPQGERERRPERGDSGPDPRRNSRNRRPRGRPR